MRDETIVEDVESDIPETPNEKKGAETNPNPPPKRAPRNRTDKARLHATKHGILARPLYEALVGRGENVRQLREIENALREELQPVGIIAELLFDRAWSSYLRCLLIVRTEARVLTPEQPTDFSFVPGLPKIDTAPFCFDDITFSHLQHLALVQRYDAHFSKDFFRFVALLLAMRDGGKAGLSKQFEKSFGKNRDQPEE